MVFPELALTGYPPEDLLLKTSFLDAARAALRELADRGEGHRRGGRLPGAGRGRLQHRRRARRRRRRGRLPQDVPAELRRVRRAALLPVGRRGRDRRGQRRAGRPQRLRGHLGARPARDERGARRRAGDREPVRLAVPRRLRRPRASGCSSSAPSTTSRPSCSCNTVGGQDELVFDGHSLAIDQDGEVVARAPQFEEALTLCTIDPRRGRRRAAAGHAPPRERAPAAPRGADRRAAGVHARDARRPAGSEADGGAAASCAARSARRPRSTRRCAPGCATTSRRTASSAW